MRKIYTFPSFLVSNPSLQRRRRLAATLISPNFGTYGAYLQQLKSQCRDEVRSDWSDLDEE